MSFYNLRNLLLGAWLLGLFFVQQSSAQGLGNSPYSALGLGELYGTGYAPNNAMGDVGVSTANGFYINPINPALLVRNRFTTFDVGVIGQLKTLQDTRQSQREFGGNLGYLALSFPASPRWSLGISLRPYTYVNYQQNSFSKLPQSIYEVKYQYKGTGGINKVSLTNGFQVGKWLSVGGEVSYLFGGYNRSASTQLLIGDGRDYIVSREDRFNVSDVNLKLGAAWRQQLRPERYLNFGATYDFRNKLNGNHDVTLEVRNSQSVELALPDTLTNVGAIVNLPQTLRVGLSYEKLYNFLIAFDYETQAWNNYVGISGTNEGFRKGQSFHLGLEYMPKYNSTKYKDLIVYRAGVSYTQTPYIIGGQTIDDLSGSVGISLPIGRNYINFINLSVASGQRGVVTNQTFKENYVRFTVGFSLKDNWFQKFKVD
jgi:hypothetical protein